MESFVFLARYVGDFGDLFVTGEERKSISFHRFEPILSPYGATIHDLRQMAWLYYSNTLMLEIVDDNVGIITTLWAGLWKTRANLRHNRKLHESYCSLLIQSVLYILAN